MSADLSTKIITAIAVLAAVVILGWTIIQKLGDISLGLLPNKTAPTSNQTGTTPDGKTIVGSDIKYVNPALCALTGQFCDPNPTNQTQAGTPDNTRVVVEAPPNYAIAPRAEILVQKLNDGIPWTQEDYDWARQFEPSLWSMAGGKA